MADRDVEIEKIGRRLQNLELRLSRLESSLNITENNFPPLSEVPLHQINTSIISDTSVPEEKGLESQIGRFGLAWLGNIVLLFGIIFLSQYLLLLGHRYVAIIFGYAAAGSLFLLSQSLKKTNFHLAFMFKMNLQILLFYITARLHFFSPTPVISNKLIVIILLLLVITGQVYLSIREKSQAFAILSLIFALTTSIIADTTHAMLSLAVLTAAISLYYYYSFNWRSQFFLSVFLTYFTLFLWLFGNPFMAHPMELVSEQHSGIIYLFGLGACFSSVLLLRLKDTTSDDYLIGLTFANGILFTLLLLIFVLRFFSIDYVPLFSVITICCLLYSIMLHSRSDWNFASAFYALYGFMTMSIALYGLIGLPHIYLFLPVQSLIVVSMALWFRNRLIVVMNSLLFLTILIIYLSTSKPISGVNFSFALIALISARIINWKKDRLQIETDMIRNLYMIEGFSMMLYALLHAVPAHFVTLSWTMAALLYFLISILLKNIKYRYMALGTMMSAAIYLFLVDLAKIEIIYRVLALLFLASISIGISMYYTNRIKKTENK